MSICCPNCQSTNIKKNGHIHNGRQNHYCKECQRQFVQNPRQKVISGEQKEQIRKLLLERIPLRGICRVMGVSLRWLLGFIVSEYETLPDDLNFHAPEQTDELIICTLESEVDEMFSFVANKQNKQWIWIAYDRLSKQIIAFHVGDRSRKSAKELFKSIPQKYRQKATFYTDSWHAYKGVIPEKQHRVIKKQSRKTNHIRDHFKVGANQSTQWWSPNPVR